MLLVGVSLGGMANCLSWFVSFEMRRMDYFDDM
jgi:hypothetical protein